MLLLEEKEGGQRLELGGRTVEPEDRAVCPEGTEMRHREAFPGLVA